MKSTLALISAFSFIVFASAFQCPEPIGYFSNPENCESFFQCFMGHSFLLYCPPGLHFNPYINVCDYKERSGCNLSKRTSTEYYTTETVKFTSTVENSTEYDVNQTSTEYYTTETANFTSTIENSTEYEVNKTSTEYYTTEAVNFTSTVENSTEYDVNQTSTQYYITETANFTSTIGNSTKNEVNNSLASTTTTTRPRISDSNEWFFGIKPTTRQESHKDNTNEVVNLNSTVSNTIETTESTTHPIYINVNVTVETVGNSDYNTSNVIL